VWGQGSGAERGRVRAGCGRRGGGGGGSRDERGGEEAAGGLGEGSHASLVGSKGELGGNDGRVGRLTAQMAGRLVGQAELVGKTAVGLVGRDKWEGTEVRSMID